MGENVVHILLVKNGQALVVIISKPAIVRVAKQ